MICDVARDDIVYFTDARLYSVAKSTGRYEEESCNRHIMSVTVRVLGAKLSVKLTPEIRRIVRSTGTFHFITQNIFDTCVKFFDTCVNCLAFFFFTVYFTVYFQSLGESLIVLLYVYCIYIKFFKFSYKLQMQWNPAF